VRAVRGGGERSNLLKYWTPSDLMLALALLAMRQKEAAAARTANVAPDAASDAQEDSAAYAPIPVWAERDRDREGATSPV
jgi:hypothetical protein